MKKALLMVLALICTIAIMLCGCGVNSENNNQSEVATQVVSKTITIGDVLSFLEREGYANVHREENSPKYRIFDSGDLKSKDKNDVIIYMNSLNNMNSDDPVYNLVIYYNNYNDEVKHILTTLYGDITNDSTLVKQIDTALTGTTTESEDSFRVAPIISGDYQFLFGDYLEKYLESDVSHRFMAMLTVDGVN